MSAVLRAVTKAGDGVVVVQPFHEMYVNQVKVFHLQPHFVSLIEDGGGWHLDMAGLESKLALPNTRVLLLNSPHNPTGKVFSERELQSICDLCVQHNVYLVTDEIYEHIIYTSTPHYCVAAWPDMKDNAIIVNSMSKTGSATGWRVGWVIASRDITSKIRAIHDTIAMQAPTPLQRAVQTLLHADKATFAGIKDAYEVKRDVLLKGLLSVGFRASEPEGAYYLFARYGGVPVIGSMGPTEAAIYLTKQVGVACVPGDNFYGVPVEGGAENQYLRFAFCRSLSHLKEAVHRLHTWHDTVKTQ